MPTAAVFVDDTQVHEQMLRQLLELEVRTLDLELSRVAHVGKQRVEQAAAGERRACR